MKFLSSLRPGLLDWVLIFTLGLGVGIGYQLNPVPQPTCGKIGWYNLQAGTSFQEHFNHQAWFCWARCYNGIRVYNQDIAYQLKQGFRHEH